MNKIHLFRPSLLATATFRKSASYSTYSSSSDDECDTKKKQNRNAAVQRTKGEAIKKLNSLLKQMVEEEVGTSQAPIKLAKPTDKRRSGVKTEPRKPPEKMTEEKIVSAAKEVAEMMGGDVKRTESELLVKLLNPAEESTAKLSDLIKGMKIDREEKSRAEQVREMQNSASARPQRSDIAVGMKRSPFRKPALFAGPVQSIDLFGEKPLGIFTADGVNKISEGPGNKTWQSLQTREMKQAVTHPPANYFQQLILWTRQGKLWKFPIDNEQGMEAEREVPFTEHVFLEKHLEPWCPAKGPIRHFMELVCVGLSKNHYLSAEHKKAHIDWYKNYFEDKKQLLFDVGAIPAGSSGRGTNENDSTSQLQ